MKRRQKMVEYLAENGFDAFFVSSYENWRYFSGFTGSNAYLVISAKELILITDQRYTEQAQNEAIAFSIFTHGLDPFPTICDALRRLNLRSVAFESKKMTDFQLRNLKKDLPGVEWVPTEDVGKRMRAVKDKEEIALVKKAIAIADETIVELKEHINPGVTEKDLAVELEYIMACKKSEGPAFGTIVAAGTRSSLPHGQPTAKIIAEGDLIVIDFGARWQGYFSDLTRTIWVGEPPREMERTFYLVEKALDTALAGVKPGITCHELDALARAVFEEASLEEYSLRGLGHGVGLEVHEFPRVVMGSNEVIEKDMVFTIEPGLYFPGQGGVRLEDIVCVTDDGCSVLTGCPRLIKV